jgi:hypothetical protein
VLQKPEEHCRTSQTHYKHCTKNSIQGTTYYKQGKATWQAVEECLTRYWTNY